MAFPVASTTLSQVAESFFPPSGKAKDRLGPLKSLYLPFNTNKFIVLLLGKNPWSCRCKPTHFSQQSYAMAVNFPCYPLVLNNKVRYLAWETVGEGERTTKMTKQEGKWRASPNAQHFEKTTASSRSQAAVTPCAERCTSACPGQTHLRDFPTSSWSLRVVNSWRPSTSVNSLHKLHSPALSGKNVFI